MINQINHERHRLTSLSQAVLVAIASTCGVGVKVALADPPVTPPPETLLPPVFCFRFTDIKAVEDDPEGDKFQIAFEVLNWSDQAAAGVRVALTEGTFGIDEAPIFAGAGIDGNGRPLGPDADPLPGNQVFNNTGGVVESTDTAIQWNASQRSFNTSTNTFINRPIPNRDLLGVGPRNTPAACALVPGCQVVGHPNPFFGTPQVADWETVDNGNNVLDGFVITVDDFDEQEVISFNWNLLGVDGNPIGMPGDGNEYGFGTVNIARTAISESLDAEFRIFEQNTGVERSNRLFAQDSYKVTEYSPSTDGEVIAMFAAEFGAGITGQFLNSEDNIFGSAVNAQLVASNPGTGGTGGTGTCETGTCGTGGTGTGGTGTGGTGTGGTGTGGTGTGGTGTGGTGTGGTGTGGTGTCGTGTCGTGGTGTGTGGTGTGTGGTGTGGTGTGSGGYDDIQPESVPEPSTTLMLGLTALALFGYKRKRRS
ncbi:hypothetical protein CYANOKiyG1_51660 [Okeania sp. KiyG1]|nr:PEP-CTERM sorting domain-containing protein [Okeania sp. KiyG1]GGA34401.1 hypothetical protein CYANOKiyG1_51660 [Okeania sp. KiyG1]